MFTTIISVPVQITTEVEALAFPNHETTNRPPEVNVANYDVAEESVVVMSRANDDDAVAEWAAMGRGGKDETYIVDVVITTQVKGRTWRQMMDRLSVLQEVVLARYTDAKGQFVPPGGLDAEGVDPLGIRTGLVNAERLNQWGTDEGWCGQTLVAIRIAARI